jgi:putative transposase
MKKRESYISKDAALSVRRQCDLLDVNRCNIYYKPVEESSENLLIMEKMDKHHLEHPTDGVLRMQDFLRSSGLIVNHKKIRRLLRLMGVLAHYPKKNLSKLGEAKYIHPYLLKDMEFTRANQVWSIDITYIPMTRGFMYLTAIIDVYSRYIVGWSLSNSLSAENSLNTLKQAIQQHGKPEIVNSDQGSQFTCNMWVEYLKNESIQISMDGKGRALDNVYIERFWRTLKRDYVYLYPEKDGIDLYRGIYQFIEYYNNHQCHQGIGRRTPVSKYKQAG